MIPNASANDGRMIGASANEEEEGAKGKEAERKLYLYGNGKLASSILLTLLLSCSFAFRKLHSRRVNFTTSQTNRGK